MSANENRGTKEFPILLVEDDKVDVEVVRRLLKRQRIDNPFLHAGDGVEALEVLERLYEEAGSVPPACLILLDLNLPRMNGLEFLQKVRESEHLNQNVAFVLSTSARNEDIATAYRLNAAGYFLKENMAQVAGLLDSYCRINQLPNPRPV